MIDRLEATKLVVELAGNEPIVASLGNPAFDLSAFDRPRNFYLWNSMGMASSLGLGLAIACPQSRVIVLDGDGALLMNLSSLATASMAGVTNLIHVVWDNGGWEITGDQPAGRSFGIDLEVIARGCGFSHTARVDTLEALREAFKEAIQARERRFIQAIIAPGGSVHRPPRRALAIRDRFMAAMAGA